MKPVVSLILYIFLIGPSFGKIDLDEKIRLIKSTHFPNIDELDVIREKCEKEGGIKVYENFKKSSKLVETCIKDFVDINNLNAEIEESKKTGSLDQVFGKYCSRRCDLVTCIQGFIDNLRLCLNYEENKALNVTTDVLKQLGDFICYKDGDRIAIFVAEGGIECIKTRAPGIQNCINNMTFEINPNDVDTNSLSDLLTDKKTCRDLDRLQNCVVQELETCSDSTPANIVDALFRFIKRSVCPKKCKRSINVRAYRIFKRDVSTIKDLTNTTTLINYIISAFKKKCPQDKEIDQGFETTKKCLSQIRLLNTPVDQFKKHFKNCTDDFVKQLETCLPEEEKYYPKFQQQILLDIIDELYASAEIIVRPNTKDEMQQCLQSFNETNTKDEVMKCLKQTDSESLKKDIVCKNLEMFNSCLMEILQEKCSVTVNEYFDNIFKVWLKGCRKDGKIGK